MLFSLLAILSFAAIFTAIFAATVFAADGNGDDAMNEIEKAFSEYRIGDTVSLENDGYIGIPVGITTYYGKDNGKATPGYNGTPLVIYVVNTRVERIGAKTDVEIISSMLERGYIVSVLDYKNNKDAVSPGLDWSTQTLRQTFKSGGYFTDKTYLPAGTYYDTFVVPAGYDVSLSNVFWETDKHGADGTLEWIVSNWNTDFRGCFKNTVVYWRDAEGNQKATQNGLDGSSPVWYSDAEGKTAVDASSADAKYTKVTYTLAEDITDCVGKDGTPVDLNLYMHVIYPTSSETSPIASVPVMALANSSEYLSDGMNTAGRPQFSGFLFNGYAGVIYDYLYQPMAQADYYGYYDGRVSLGAVTDDRMNYGLQLYNDKRINTAAMRYIRYLAATNGDTYAFDTDKIGVIGNSKGGWFTFLGEAELRNYTVSDTSGMTVEELNNAIDTRINSYTSKRVFDDHNNETRYQNGKTGSYTKRGITVDGGELQPWLTYTDGEGNVHELLGYAAWTYASNGSQPEDITAGHAPIYAVLHTGDDFTTTNNAFGEVSGCLDIPSFYCVVDLGHTFAYGPDAVYGFDTYQAMFDFANYYLKNSAVRVVYTDPASGTGNIDTTGKITVKFSGAVPLSEVSKITVKDVGGSAVSGSWSAIRGNTEWTFTPSEALKGGTEYTLTIPEDLKGDNGVSMGEAVNVKLYTEAETVNGVSTVKATEGTFITVTRSELSDASDAAIRFYASNDAANVMELYGVTDYDAAAPENAVIGACVGSVNLSGAGYYEIDVTDTVLNTSISETVTFLLKEKKSAGVSNTYNASFTSSLSGISLGAYSRGEIATAPDGTAAARLYVTYNINSAGKPQYGGNDVYYDNQATLFTSSALFGTEKVTRSDLGRRYKITMRVYDTVSRTLSVQLNGAYTDTNGVLDFDRVYHNVKTVAGQWTDIEIDYTVYEPSYGDSALSAKKLTVFAGSANGKGTDAPIYLSSVTVSETVTDVSLDDVSLVSTERGSAYKPSASEYSFSVGDAKYPSLSAALSAAKSGDTVKLLANYTATDSDVFTGAGALSSITLELNGYKLYAKASSSLICARADSLAVASTEISIQNGDIILFGAPLIGYGGSTSAGKGKIYNIVLKNVTIMNGNGSSLAEVLSESSIASASGATVNIDLDACRIDLSKGKNTNNPITVFPTGDGALSINYSVKGGSLSLDTLVRVTLWEKYKKLAFTKGEDGEYMTLSLPSSVKAPSVPVLAGGEASSFTALSADKLISVYAPRSGELSTKYGIIPEEYSNAESYPFIMFDENGSFKGAYTSFLDKSSGALNAAKVYVANAWDGSSYGTEPKEAFIIMRRDYTLTQKSEWFDNLAQLQGTVNIDLGGYTLSSGSVAYPLFPAFSKGFSGAAGEKVFPTTVKVSNGALRTYQNGVVAMSTWDSLGGGTIAKKDFNFIFTDVTFGFVENALSAGLTNHGWSANGTPGAAAPFNFTYNDCTFDLRTARSKSDPVIFALSTTAGKYIKMTVNVNGGKIISDDPSNVTVVQTTSSDTYGSSVSFGKGSDGKYTEWYVPSGKAPSVGGYSTASNEALGFVFSESGESDDVYILSSEPFKTEYGTIGNKYADAKTYPFVNFDGNGGFLGGYTSMKAAIDAAKGRNEKSSYSAENKTLTVILLRRDYTTVSGDSYANWAQNMGDITIDLGGHTLTQGAGTAGIFTEVVSKGWSSKNPKVFPSTYTVKNGTLLVLDKSVVNAKHWATVKGNGEMAAKYFTWNFEDCTFGFAKGATSESLLVSYLLASDSPDVAAPFYFNYTNCTFDLETNAPSGNVTLFNAAPADGSWLKVAVTVTGGTVKASSLENKTLYAVESVYGSSVTFAKGSDGNYPLLYVTEAKAPAEGFGTAEGTLYYVNAGTDGRYTVYKLIKESVKKFVPKTGISFRSEICYNIYLPSFADIKKITLAGSEVDISKLSTEDIDGVGYYYLQKVLSLSEAAEDFILTVTLDIGNGRTATGKWTMSAVRYAKLVIEDENSSEEEIALMKDMLEYIASAYAYLENENAEEIKEAVTEITGESYAEGAEPSEDTLEVKTELPGIDSASVEAESGNAFIFYPEVNGDGELKYSAESYVFTQNGKTLDTKILTDTEGRTYIRVEVCAYGLASDISYSVRETDISGEYNIRTYYEYVKTLSDSEGLQTLIKRLWKYAESAAAYRAYVLSNR